MSLKINNELMNGFTYFFFIIIEWILNKAREPFKLMEIQQKEMLVSIYIRQKKQKNKKKIKQLKYLHKAKYQVEWFYI